MCNCLKKLRHAKHQSLSNICGSFEQNHLFNYKMTTDNVKMALLGINALLHCSDDTYILRVCTCRTMSLHVWVQLYSGQNK